jgi:uncharacterized protein
MLIMMYTEKNQIIYSPSDLTLYMDSPFASWMERRALIKPELLSSADAADEMMLLLQKKGSLYEKEVLESFLTEKLNVVQIVQNPDSEQDTYAAMQSGADVIYQAALSVSRFKGYADFLIKVEGKSGFGNYYYEVWDTKLSKTLKPYVVMQLCCYAEMLERLQGRRPDYIVAALGNGERRRLRTNDYFYYYQNLKSKFLQVHQDFSEHRFVNPADSSRWGRWTNHAENILHEADHLSQIATITRSQIKKLHKAGVHTMQAIADTDCNFAKGIDVNVLMRLKAQAKIQKDSHGRDTPLYKILPHKSHRKIGLALLPPSSPLDIYFDIEGFPLEEGGLEYLWGLTYFDTKGVRQFKDFWAHNKEEEKASFKAFIEWTYKRWLQDPTMHIYHYANYEIAACRKLMGRYGVCEQEVDQLLRNEVFVDLYKVVKGGLLLGEPRYSIKNVEHLYRAKRSTEVGSGGDSVVVYERWQDDKDGDTWETSKILNSIREYNIDDCNSTQELVDWLRLRQKEGGIDYLGITEVTETGLQEEVTDRIQLREKLLKKAVQLKDQGDIKNAEVHSLFAWTLEFHRREKKPMYWRLFDRIGLSDDELVDDIDCLALCIRTNKLPYKLKPRDRNYIYEYKFDPSQEFKGDCKQYIVLGVERDNSKSFNVETIKEKSCFATGLVALKSSQELESIITLIPDENIPVKPIPEAITKQAEALLSGDLADTAIVDFLMRNIPRIIDHQSGKPITLSGNPHVRLLEIIKAVCSLDNSYLAIQGAPGSGKTYTGKHVIAELLKLGKKIGISSNSHKAINNLLINTAEYCNSKGITGYFACTKDTDQELTQLGVDIYKNSDIARNLQPSCVIGTTAWGFARSDLENTFDYLFIDEAGQVSIANLIAMGRSAKNIILMGDQMQLGQPSQGSHPEDSGLSILDYLLSTTPTIHESMGVFLGTTYRMHSDVNRFISDAIYEGKLESDLDNDLQYIKVPDEYQGILNKEAGIIPVPVCHDGNTQASEEEVNQIVLLARQLVGRIFTAKNGIKRLIDWSDMLFIAPYNHQVNKLRSALGDRAKVGSIDKFQGQEAPIVFLSMCSSNANDSVRGMEFLFSKNRINVAISRAQCMAIVVYSPTLLETSASNLNQLEMANLFCKLVGVAE